MIANTTQDSAGIPWNRVRIGDRKSLAARERNIDTASAAPATNAPARPARMRPTVASTSASWLQLVNMSKQRLKTSINDGNRNGGKNSEAICQRAARTAKGRM